MQETRSRCGRNVKENGGKKEIWMKTRNQMQTTPTEQNKTQNKHV